MKILLGGSPCTYWSIAQKNNRETEPSGLGWELFKNYLIAKEKFKPDIFLYENNKSAAKAIKDEIKKQFGVWDGTMFMEDTGVRYIEINSALVSAQNRQRFYIHNCGNVKQPEDRGILLKDILESGIVEKEKGYCLKHQAGNARDYFKKHHTNIKFEPIRVGDMGSKAQGYRIYSIDGKSVCINSGGGGLGAKTGLYAEPLKYLNDKNMEHLMRPFGSKGKIVSEDAECATFSPPHGYNKGLIQYDKFPTLTTGSQSRQQNVLIEKCQPDLQIETPLSFINKVYEVRNGYITIKDKQYPVKLKDGFYIIRKLTVTECCRLQTMPEVEHCLYINFNTGEICLDLQKINAQNAAEKCHKLQKFAKSVQEIDLLEFVQFVENNTNIRLQQNSEPVLLSVHTNLEGLSNQKDYSMELLKNANIAGKNLRCLNQEQTEIFAQAIVGITTMLRKITQIGTVELRLKDKIFAVVKNGKMQFTLCGTEIMQLVKDADINMNKVKKAITSTILEVLPNLEICEQILTTLFCYVLNAIGGYILQKTNGEILLKIKTPYTYAVSNSQAYKGLGNGWTAEVIIHILSNALKDVPRDTPIQALSMYDGIGTGRYVLDKMGFTNVEYHAYEIDKYAMQIAMSNYPDIIQRGDAFQVREDDWGIE